MARGRSSKASKAWSNGPMKLTADVFHGFLRAVAATKQKCDDANMANAGQWKKAEPQGIHPAAAKVIAKLDGMEDTKRADFLRSFDHMRSLMPWTAQADIFETEQTAAGDPDHRDDDGEGRDAEDPAEREPADALVAEEREPVAEVEADVGEEIPTEVTEELERVPGEFAAGRKAAGDGQPAEANPHPEGGVLHTNWARGHKLGPIEEEAETSVVPLNERRRGRRAAAETAASLH